MGKWIVIGLLSAVFTTVAGMWFMLDANRNRLLASRMSFASSHAAQPVAGSGGAKMVEPESLEQGFIIVVTDKTKVANASSPIYMPSSHNGWNPADAKMKLEAQSDMKWRITWNKPTLDSRVAFKFARGSWEAVECKADFSDVDNRTLPLVDVSKLKPGEKPVIELEVQAWKDQRPGDASAMAANRFHAIKVGAGRLERIAVAGGGVSTLNRDVLVWLPPGYDKPENQTRTYPVLYLNDGQNVFEKIPSIPAEWEADETAGRLIEAGKIEPLVIVGIPNAGGMRMQEYMPIAAFDKTPARGVQYVDFVVHEVMPRIERAFRVKTGPANTAIGGSSLGGVISIEAATAHPEKFGIVLAESTPLTGRLSPLMDRFGQAKAWPGKMYFGIGSNEDAKDAVASQGYVDASKQFAKLAESKGLSAANFKLVIEDGATHDEKAWARRFGPALEFLFPAGK